MDNRNQAVALGLMQMAMTFLEKAGDHATAPLLQHAIDTALKLKPLKPGEVVDPETACLIAGIPLDD